MKRTGMVVLAAFCAVLLASVPARAKQTKEEREAAELQAKREQEARAALNGTSWTIDMSRLGQKGDKPAQDTLKFDAEKITSVQFAKSGYSPSHITVTVGDGDLVIWETMQRKEGEGVVFWRGERQGEIMRGIVSKQPADGNNQDFSFSGKIVGAPPPPAPAAQPAVTGEAAPASSAAAPEAMAPAAQAAERAPEAKPDPAPKKKGWWW